MSFSFCFVICFCKLWKNTHHIQSIRRSLWQKWRRIFRSRLQIQGTHHFKNPIWYLVKIQNNGWSHQCYLLGWRQGSRKYFCKWWSWHSSRFLNVRFWRGTFKKSSRRRRLLCRVPFYFTWRFRWIRSSCSRWFWIWSS